MKILLVWPNKDDFGWKPIGLSLLSSILKKLGHDVALFDTTYIDFGIKDHTTRTAKAHMHKVVKFKDEDLAKSKLDLEVEILNQLNSFKPDIVGVSVLSDEIDAALAISKIVKKWNKKIFVLWGNKLPTMNPEKILKDNYDVDYLCIGEGIYFIKDFVECIAKKGDPRKLRNIAYRTENGQIKVNPLKPLFQDLDSLPYLDWSIFDKRHFSKPFDGKAFRGGDHMMFWGCPNSCTYCINESYRKLYMHRKQEKFLRWYTVPRIINELEFLVSVWGVTLFKFHDEDFCLKPLPYFEKLSKAYAKRINVPFVIMANAHTITKDKVKLLKKMNCVSVSLGMETGNPNLRSNMLKRKETEKEIIQATHMLNDAGIRTASFNMIGLPFETRKTIFETIELNRKAKIRYPAAQFFFPLEGTPLRKVAIENGFFDADSTACFRRDKPSLKFKDISEEELIQIIDRFTLYIKLPRSLHKYIARSEKNDKIGRRLTKELYKIFDTHVFLNNGFFDENCNVDEYIARLENIYKNCQ